eukprot:GEMP01051199.1.p1 GENE.GEMP01051199.1~~GEMP01051199.1.p1  ORF type:complete len:369 (+),score=71.09 GEMP01051199.1:159-1265(+)
MPPRPRKIDIRVKGKAASKKLAAAAAMHPKLDEWCKEGPDYAQLHVLKRQGKRLDLLGDFGEDYFYSMDRVLVEKEEPVPNEVAEVPDIGKCADLTLAGANLVFMGLGSKVKFLEELRVECNKRGAFTLHIPGYQRAIHFGRRLRALLHMQFSDGDKIPECHNAYETAEELGRLLQERAEQAPVVVVVDSICRLEMDDVEILSQLATYCDRFHLVCSVDHVHWLQAVGLPHGCYSVLECHTMEPYEHEIVATEDLTSEIEEGNAECTAFVTRVRHVLESLNRNQAEIFFLICNQQRTTPGGISEAELLTKASHLMLATKNYARLRSHICEFMDHKILAFRPQGKRFVVKVDDPAELDAIIALKQKLNL